MNYLLYSGGVDSTALLFELKQKQEKTKLIFCNYGQLAYQKELRAVQYFAKKTNCELKILDFRDHFAKSQSKLVNINGKGGYELEDRNVGLILFAFFEANKEKENVDIYLGIAKMQNPYIDCTKQFVRSTEKFLLRSTNGKVQIKAPFIDVGKDDIVKMAKEHGVNMRRTWSCYSGNDKPCGSCPACIDCKILGVKQC